LTLDDLRLLLVGPEQERIRRLEERIDTHFDETVAGVLPQAVVKSREEGDALAWAMRPIVEASVAETVRRDPAAFADAISPAIGPGIRKAVAHALRTMVERLQAAIDQSLTLASLRWRIEARRTARPFAEVVLLRTLVYRVEQVFLIHRGTGLPLVHLTADAVPAQDPDQVAGMLSAIERFAHEAFREDARLERFRVGELAGMVVHGPSALLVAIVRGAAPEDYEARLRRVLERAHLEYAAALEDFRGDPRPFDDARQTLAGCLEERLRAHRRSRLAPALLVAGLTIAVGLGAGAWTRRQHRLAALAAYAEALAREPGVVVTAAEPHGREVVLKGLRDPLAADPAAVLGRSGLAPERATLRFEPFYSLDPRIVARRIAALLRPPAEVSLALHGTTLEARGIAPERWIERARSAASMLPGVEAFAGDHLYAKETIARERALAAALDGTELVFLPGEGRLADEEHARLAGAAAEARELDTRAPEAGMRVRIAVIGYTDPTGTEAVNRRLGLARAEYVVAELVARGVASGALQAQGGGVRREVLGQGCAPEAARTGCEAADRHARSVVLRVALDAVPEG
jgi:OOP family OmpA-OmpF porin